MNQSKLLAQVNSCIQKCLDLPGSDRFSCERSCASTGGGEGGKIINPVIGDLGNLSGLEFLQKLLPALIGLGFVAGIILFFFVMVLGAIQWITSGGDKQALDGAKGKITNAIIGLIILFSLIAIIKLIEAFLGVNILTIDIGPLKIE